MAKQTKIDLNKEAKRWGIGLIIIGLIYLYSISIYIGAILLMSGIIFLILKKDWSLMLIGFLLVIVGGMGIIGSIMIEESFSYFGLTLMIFGALAFRQYYILNEGNMPDDKKWLLIGVIAFSVALLVITFSLESKISWEMAMVEAINDKFTEKGVGGYYWLTQEIKSGSLTLEYVYSVLDEDKKRINESARLIDYYSKYSLLTYMRWNGLNNRREYNTIFSDSFVSSLETEKLLMKLCSQGKC